MPPIILPNVEDGPLVSLPTVVRVIIPHHKLSTKVQLSTPSFSTKYTNTENVKMDKHTVERKVTLDHCMKSTVANEEGHSGVHWDLLTAVVPFCLTSVGFT